MKRLKLFISSLISFEEIRWILFLIFSEKFTQRFYPLSLVLCGRSSSEKRDEFHSWLNLNLALVSTWWFTINCSPETAWGQPDSRGKEKTRLSGIRVCITNWITLELTVCPGILSVENISINCRTLSFRNNFSFMQTKTWIMYSLGCKFYSWVEISDPRPFSEFIWVWIILEWGTISPFNTHWISSQSMIRMVWSCVNSKISMIPIRNWFLTQFRKSTLISANFDRSAFLVKK